MVIVVTDLRITPKVAQILQSFLAQPDHPYYGLELAEYTGIHSGTVYPILSRLRDVGWLSSVTENGDPTVMGRPLRRLHRLTLEGLNEAAVELSVFNERTKEEYAGMGSES
jgi:PadR family transcriptional regulator PadR